MALQPMPLIFGKFHALPIFVTRSILLTELDPPRLAWRAFSCGNMRLELDRICSGIRNSINESVSKTQTAVMGLGDLADN